MPSLFTRIIRGELTGRFVWKDPQCVAFLTIQPIRPGHLLVVPREEIDHWIDLPDALAAHLMATSKTIAAALQQAFAPEKVGLIIAGLEVRHVHLHLIPIRTLGDLSFANADAHAKVEDMDAAAALIRKTLRARGCSQVAD